MRIPIVCLLMLLTARAGLANQPPSEVTYPLGRDSKGRPWTAKCDWGRTVGLRGPATYTFQADLQYWMLGLHAIDKRDRALLADSRGRAVFADLVTGRTEYLDLPKQGQSAQSLQLHNDAVWYVDRFGSGTVSRVMRYDLATRKAAVQYLAEPGTDLDSMSIVGSTIWLAGAAHNGVKTSHRQVLALDLATAKVLTRVEDRTPTDAHSSMTVKAESPQVAWIHDSGDERLLRVDGSGKSQAWSTSPRSIHGFEPQDGKVVFLFATVEFSGTTVPVSRVVDAYVGVIDATSDRIEAVSASYPGSQRHAWLKRDDAGSVVLNNGQLVTLVDGKPSLSAAR